MRKIRNFGIACLIGLAGCNGASNINYEIGELERHSWIRCGQVLERHDNARKDRIYPDAETFRFYNLMINEVMLGQADRERRLELLDVINNAIDAYKKAKEELEDKSESLQRVYLNL